MSKPRAHSGGMRTIGLIGGMSWHSTMTYYRLLNESVANELGGHASARMVLQALDFAEVRACQVTGDWQTAGRLLADEVGLGKTIEAALVLSQLWAERRRRLVRGNEQWFTFVDPHGIRMVTDPANEPKLHLWKTLKEIEGRHPGLGVHLDAWILSVTPEHEVSPLLRPFLDHHIVYQDNEGRYLEMLMRRLLGIEGRTVAGAP